MVVEKQKLKYFPGEFTVRCFVSTSSNEDFVYSECYFKETNVITSVHLKNIDNGKIVVQVDILLYSLF